MNDDGDEEIVENGRLCLSLSLSHPTFLSHISSFV